MGSVFTSACFLECAEFVYDVIFFIFLRKSQSYFCFAGAIFLWKEMTFLRVSVSLYCRNSENYEETIHRKECLFTWFNTVYNFNFSDFICWIKIVMLFHIFFFVVLCTYFLWFLENIHFLYHFLFIYFLINLGLIMKTSFATILVSKNKHFTKIFNLASEKGILVSFTIFHN